MATATGANTRGNNNTRKNGDTVAAARRKTTRTTTKSEDDAVSTVDSLNKCVDQQAKQIRTLTKERDEAYAEINALRNELQQMKESRSENPTEMNRSQVVGKRKSRKKRRIDHNDCCHEETPICDDTNEGRTSDEMKDTGNQTELPRNKLVSASKE